MHTDTGVIIEPYDYQDFDLSIEEIVPNDLMVKIIMFTDGTLSQWGVGVKK